MGKRIPEENLRNMVSGMIDKLFAMFKPEAIDDDTKGLLRLPPLSYNGEIDCVMFSGGVSEFIYNRAKTSFGDLGPLIADEVHRRAGSLGLLVMEPNARIRATVIGASQYTVQVSGNTIFIARRCGTRAQHRRRRSGVPVRSRRVEQRSGARAFLALRRLDLLTAGNRSPWRFTGTAQRPFPGFSFLQRRGRRAQGNPRQRPPFGTSQRRRYRRHRRTALSRRIEIRQFRLFPSTASHSTTLTTSTSAR